MKFNTPSESRQVDNNLKNSQTCLKKVGIIGAGPAGLATAIALRKQGIEVHIYPFILDALSVMNCL